MCPHLEMLFLLRSRVTRFGHSSKLVIFVKPAHSRSVMSRQLTTERIVVVRTIVDTSQSKNNLSIEPVRSLHAVLVRIPQPSLCHVSAMLAFPGQHTDRLTSFTASADKD
jgi:hypothetical protein